MKFKLTLLSVLLCLIIQAQPTPADIRIAIAKSVTDLNVAPEPVADIKNDLVMNGKDSIAIRIYRPVANKKLPVIYLVHGAGWIAGDLDTHDNICRHLANKLQAIVVAVNYRRAPEHKFPAPFDDSYLVFKWIHSNMKKLKGNGKLIVMGDSAGGQLAASICIVNSLEKKPVPVTAQVLVNPALNLSKGSVSYTTYPYFIDWYLNITDSTGDERISPLLAKDISKTPPAIIVTGEKDGIRNDGEEFHKKLLEAGISSSLYIQPERGHLAQHFCAAGEKAKPAIDYVVGKLKELYLK
jgi:acetyl esterase